MKIHVNVLAAALSLSGLLCAADFWEKKKFPDWSDKEVQKMLKDSPWAKPLELTSGAQPAASGSSGRGGRGGGGGGTGGTSPDSIGPGNFPDASRGSTGSFGRDGVGGEGGDPSGQGSFVRTGAITAIVRWQSALPVKQAMAKNKYGAEAATSAEAAKALTRSEHYYIVAVSGLPPKIKEPKASLEIPGKDPIESSDVKAGTDGKTVVLYFIFPRTPITLEDKEVDFIFKVGDSSLKRKFRLKDMVFEGNLEL